MENGLVEKVIDVLPPCIFQQIIVVSNFLKCRVTLFVQALQKFEEYTIAIEA